MNWIKYLRWMQEKGSCVTLTWAEDEDYWECSWISGGKRFVGRHIDPIAAINACYVAGTGEAAL